MIQALGTGGSQTGVNIGAGCNNLYVDLNKPVAFVTLKALPPYGYSGLMGYAPTWQNSFASMDVWLQGAWADTKTKEFKLTSATNITFPSSLPPDELPRYKTLYQRDTTTSTGFGPFTSGVYFPFTRYKTN